ncbi:flagellar hook assembly protein FlgD [Rhizosaccharibacter radicis]|uniref:Basal-body rod modification protein FlgD n=1 Tax=Rhizosaccharibacter radicis TaxID=2782605 RepID=A0ABT1VU73_9PROT|nr:flagellar biosynthesis protein FlgD [Acetobacteraceae bacterium KSS12]
MTTTTATSTPGLSRDPLEAARNAAKTAASSNVSKASGTGASDATSGTGSSALSSLTSNFNQFLTLLTAQLQHQDPTSPMDNSSFTSELAQFAGVQQQVQSNTNLQQLISLSQDNQVTSGTDLVGRQALASTSILPLQNGSATLRFDASAAEPIAVAVTDATGKVVKTDSFTATAGTNSWHWDGKGDDGSALADGAYNVSVMTGDGASSSTAVPFSVLGTITGVNKTAGGGVGALMGGATIDMNDITSLLSGATAASAADTTA